MKRLVMLNLSYTLTPKLRVNVDAINRARSRILNLKLSREKELRLAWQAKIARTYASLSMSGNPSDRHIVAKMMTETKSDQPISDRHLLDILSYTKAQDYINQNWYVTEKAVKPAHIYKLFNIATRNDRKTHKKYKPEISQFLDYLEKGDEHPAIKAGVAQIQLRLVSPFSSNNGRITRLLSQLYLYKYDLNMRGILALDEYWKDNTERFRQETDVAALDKSITGWLEFYTDALVDSAQKAYYKARDDRKVVGVQDKFWKITNRQKQIMSLLDNPDISITNRDVQEKFNVSQVTASRDLSDLARKGLIFKHGDGRSVRYTRV